MKLKYTAFLFALMGTAQLHSAENEPLGMSIYNGDYPTFLTFFQNNNFNVNDTLDGDPMLHVVLDVYADSKESPALQTKKAPVSKMITFLLENKNLLINQTDTDGNTALHRAIARGLTEMVPLLISHGADVDVQNKYGTPLHNAVLASNPDMVALLLKNNARTDIKNYLDLTPYHLVLEILDSLNNTTTLLEENSKDRLGKEKRLTIIRDMLKSVNPNHLQKIREREKVKPSADTFFTFE